MINSGINPLQPIVVTRRLSELLELVFHLIGQVSSGLMMIKCSSSSWRGVSPTNLPLIGPLMR